MAQAFCSWHGRPLVDVTEWLADQCYGRYGWDCRDCIYCEDRQAAEDDPA